MSHRVKWTKRARRLLAAAYTSLSSADKNALTIISDRLERRIALLPWTMGESRMRTTRIASDSGLTVTYDIIEDDHVVKITDVKITRLPLG